MSIIEHEPAHEYHRYPPVALGIHALLDSDPNAGGNLAKFHAHHIEGHPRPETDALLMGRAAHACILEGRDIASNRDPEFVVHERTYINAQGKPKPWRWGAKPCDDWKDLQDRSILKPDWMDTIAKMKERVDQDPDCSEFLADGKAEVVIRREDPETGLMKQSRFDKVCIEKLKFADLKTYHDDTLAAFPRESLFLHYDRIISWYSRIFAEEMGEPWPSDRIDGRILASCKLAPWSCQLYRFSLNRLTKADQLNQQALYRLAEAYETGYWGDDSGGVITID